MPNQKISELTDGSPAQASDQIPVNRSGTNFRVNASTVGVIQSATVTLHEAQMKNLIASPPVIVPAPGIGKVIGGILGVLQYKRGTVDYNVDVLFAVGPPSNPDSDSMLEHASPGVNGQNGANSFAMMAPFTSPSDALSVFENQPYVITQISGSELTTGDGTLTVTVYHIIVPLL